MSQPHPPDHAALIARRDFVFPPGDYTDAERGILRQYGRWLEGLATGSILPLTPGQAQFVETARGHRDPETDFERAWRTVLVNRGVGFDVNAAFHSLMRARSHRAALEEEYAAARSVILAKVKAQLAAVDEEYAARLAEAAAFATEAEQAARDLVVRTGKSVYFPGVRAVYSAPRVTWDTPKLEAYAETHPEVKEFRKVGKPWVNLRFLDKPMSGTDTEEPIHPPEETGGGEG